MFLSFSYHVENIAKSSCIQKFCKLARAHKHCTWSSEVSGTQKNRGFGYPKLIQEIDWIQFEQEFSSFFNQIFSYTWRFFKFCPVPLLHACKPLWKIIKFGKKWRKSLFKLNCGQPYSMELPEPEAPDPSLTRALVWVKSKLVFSSSTMLKIVLHLY